MKKCDLAEVRWKISVYMEAVLKEFLITIPEKCNISNLFLNLSSGINFTLVWIIHTNWAYKYTEK